LEEEETARDTAEAQRSLRSAEESGGVCDAANHAGIIARNESPGKLA
jgi:hypothetical protein